MNTSISTIIMTNNLKVVLILLLPVLGRCWWPFSSGEQEDTPSQDAAALETRKVVQFEMSSAEQKFLAEAQQFLDLPQLDQCQHVVISRLRSSCGEITETDLGKLAVELLNCQSETEGRPTYKCSPHMSLSDCTGSMDASTWNAYHIISNRARSVCYATRQEHFKRQTEVAVNKLSQSTIQQLQTVRELASSHKEIKDFAQESLQTMQFHQSELAERQVELTARQDTVRDKITINLEQLAKERTLIHHGQDKLVNMTDNIKQQLEEASSLLANQEESRKQGQSEIIEDITKVKDNIQHVWSRVDNSTSQLLRVMAEIGNQYESTLNNLERINSSVSSMMELVVAMDSVISGQLDWLIGQLGGAQDGLRILVLLATHAAFLLMATLAVLFVKAPGFARVALLVMVCVNVFCGIRYRVSLTLYGLAAVEALLIIGNWLFLWFNSSHRPKPSLPPTQPLPLSQTTWDVGHTHFTKEDRFKRSSTPISSEDESDIEGGYGIETLTHTPTKPVHSTSLRHSLMSKCTAKTRTGSRCKFAATPGENHCRRHLGMNH